jgi:hypothetical protein
MSSSHTNHYIVKKSHELHLLYKNVDTNQLGIGRAGLMVAPPELPTDVNRGVELIHTLINGKVQVLIR